MLPDPVHRYKGDGNATDSVGGLDNILGPPTKFGPGVNGLGFDFNFIKDAVVELFSNINPFIYPNMTSECFQCCAVGDALY